MGHEGLISIVFINRTLTTACPSAPNKDLLLVAGFPAARNQGHMPARTQADIFLINLTKLIEVVFKT